MQQTAISAGRYTGRIGDRKRIETVVETLATLRNQGESLSAVAHDARNMVTALGLYCDLLEEPGVLAAPFSHYGTELRLVAAASRRLVEKLVALDAHAAQGMDAQALPEIASEVWAVTGAANSLSGQEPNHSIGQSTGRNEDRKGRWDLLPAVPMANLAAELLANRNLLSALAGPSVGLTMDADGGARPVRLTGEDLTRVLVNLVKNAAEAMPKGGRIHIGVSERSAAEGAAACVTLVIEDSGPGIPEQDLEQIFASGYTRHGNKQPEVGDAPFRHRGLGLAIVRSIVDAAGGRIWAANREQGGARFTIELPVRKAGL